MDSYRLLRISLQLVRRQAQRRNANGSALPKKERKNKWYKRKLISSILHAHSSTLFKFLCVCGWVYVCQNTNFRFDDFKQLNCSSIKRVGLNVENNFFTCRNSERIASNISVADGCKSACNDVRYCKQNKGKNETFIVALISLRDNYSVTSAKYIFFFFFK